MLLAVILFLWYRDSRTLAGVSMNRKLFSTEGRWFYPKQLYF